MSGLRMLLARVAGLFRRGGAGRIEQEMAAHLEMLAAEYEGRGMTREAALATARREFGGAAQIAEAWRDQRSLPFVETLAQDLRYALRQLRGNPGFTASAVVTLALGIGANAAIFRVLDAVLLRSLPVKAPEELVLVGGFHDDHQMSFSYPLFEEMGKRQQVVAGMLASTDFPVQNSDIKARIATGGYFRVLGVNARLGRVFTEEDDRESGPAVAVISDGYWRRAFGGQADVLGRVLTLNSGQVTVIGVAPPGFFGERVGGAPDVWVPMHFAAQVWTKAALSPAMAMLQPMARLRADVPVWRAEAVLNGLYGELADFNVQKLGTSKFRLELKPGSQGLLELQEVFSAPLRVLMAIAGLVLLLACANLANLLLARAAARSHEIAVRLALGAGRGRLVRQLLTESLALAALGGACGAAMAIWGSRVLITLASAGHPWKIAMEMGWRMPAFLAAVTVAAAMLFGLAPALIGVRSSCNRGTTVAATRFSGWTRRTSRPVPLSGRTETAGRSRQGASRAFVVAQVSISLVLVMGAALLVRSFWNLRHQDFGYRPEGVLMVSMRIDMGSFRAARELVTEPVYRRMNEIPGVRSAALASMGPFASLWSNASMALPDHPASNDETGARMSVSPRYFETMGIPIVRGRAIGEEDRAGTTKVAVISETAARRVFGVSDPIGRVFTEGPQFDAGHAVEVVGVARDIRFGGPSEPYRVVVYLPLAQAPMPLTSIAVRTAGDPLLFAGAIREAVREAAPRIPIAKVALVEELVSAQMGQERMMALLSGAFGVLALVLAAVGLYGLIAYGVERRTQEIGIRLALGASGGQVAGMLLRQIAWVLLLGVVVGGGGTLALGRWVRSLLFGLTPHDPAMLGSAALLLAVVAMVAGYVPARRASRIDPMTALRRD